MLVVLIAFSFILIDLKVIPLLKCRMAVFSIVCRLSEPNMASISAQLEELYMTHSRKDMNDTLTGVLMSACAPAVAVPSRLVMEHMLLVSILHRTVGIEVGLCRGLNVLVSVTDLRRLSTTRSVSHHPWPRLGSPWFGSASAYVSGPFEHVCHPLCLRRPSFSWCSPR